MSPERWDTALDSLKRELANSSWVVLAASGGANLGREQFRRLLGLADEDERRRYQASAGGPAAVHSVVGGILLRRLLQHLTGVEGSAFRFETGPHGKPFLAGSNPAIHFNVSHCASHGLIALSNRFEIGVDAETIADYKQGVARRILPPEDFERLDRLGRSERARLFYRLWVIKEACVKATGAGFSTPLRDVAVSLDAVQGRWGPVRWRVLDIGADACACVAIVGGGASIDRGRLCSIDAIEALKL
jgi:phosphopantetheinyl transferase